MAKAVGQRKMQTLILSSALTLCTCCAAAAGTVESQRDRRARLEENRGIARAERAAEEKTEATLTAAVTPMRLLPLLPLPLRRAARAAPLRTASIDWD